jgi:hypothetical protein
MRAVKYSQRQTARSFGKRGYHMHRAKNPLHNWVCLAKTSIRMQCAQWQLGYAKSKSGTEFHPWNMPSIYSFLALIIAVAE